MGEQVRHWFEEAVDLPAASRAAFLDQHCADPAVRAEVLSLLDYDGDPPEAAGRLAPEQVVKDAVGAVLGPNPHILPARRVGPFEIGRLLGSGGMGLVYEAHRVDGEVRQRVAVKFAQVSAAASASVREAAHRRFSRERQVLASLQHPYIASLIDAGTTKEGVPYAVIEQVDGVPIDAYCDAAELDQAGRLQLVLKLCDAVQFAHRNLIVHSDLKPDNVLVTAGGIPKLIDFGVANDLAGEASLTSMRAFTPGYASPEQCRGLPATVATDVYGLGALLYRLLTGAMPRELKGSSLTEVVRHISEEDVVRPSLRKPQLKGDLENILLKALQREPNRRYGSVQELADDLQRFLALEPVRATPDSIPYRVRRFARRHWIGFAAAVLLVLGLSVATAVSVHQREKALRRAMETRRLAERLLFEVHDEIAGVVGGTRAREKLGAIAVEYLETLERDYGRDPELAWELVRAYARLGQSRGGAASSIGDTRSGADLAAKALRLGATLETASMPTKQLDELFAVYSSLAPVFQEAGRPAQQRETVDRLLRIAPRLEPLRVAQAYRELARYHEANAAIRESAEAHAKALPILRMLSQSAAKPAGTDALLTSSLVSLGRSQALAGDYTAAVASLQEAVARSEAQIAAEPRNARSARQLYWSSINLGDVFGSPARFSLERPNDAVAHYERARRIAETLLQADPGNDVAKLDLARTYSRHAAAVAATQPAAALALLERAHAVLLTASQQNLSALEERFSYLTSSVPPLVKLGQLERARFHIVEARRLSEEMKAKGARPPEAAILIAEALRLHANGQQREALAEARKHLALLPEKTNPVLSENFEAVALLERMRVYAAGLDPAVCATATARLERIWSDLAAIDPKSDFVRNQRKRAAALRDKACQQAPPSVR